MCAGRLACGASAWGSYTGDEDDIEALAEAEKQYREAPDEKWSELDHADAHAPKWMGGVHVYLDIALADNEQDWRKRKLTLTLLVRSPFPSASELLSLSRDTV